MMQAPEHAIGDVRYRALPACLAPASSRPAALVTFLEWVVVTLAPGGEQTAGWIAADPHGAIREPDAGPYACYLQADPHSGTPLRYVANAASSRQGTRLIAEAHQAARQAQKADPG